MENDSLLIVADEIKRKKADYDKKAEGLKSRILLLKQQIKDVETKKADDLEILRKRQIDLLNELKHEYDEQRSTLVNEYEKQRLEFQEMNMEKARLIKELEQIREIERNQREASLQYLKIVVRRRREKCQTLVSKLTRLKSIKVDPLKFDDGIERAETSSRNVELHLTVRTKKFDDQVQSSREIGAFETRKLRRQIIAARERVEIAKDRMDSENARHHTQMRKLQAEVMRLADVDCYSRTTSSSSSAVYKRRIERLNSSFQDYGVYMAALRQTLKREQEKNIQLHAKIANSRRRKFP